MTNKKNLIQKIKPIAKYSGFVIIAVVLTFARIDAVISPFAAALMFASVYAGLNLFAAAGVVFGLSFFNDTDQTSIISNAFAVVIFIVFASVFRKKKTILQKKRLDLPFASGAFILANVLSLYFAYSQSIGRGESPTLFYQTVTGTLIGVVFLLCLITVIQTVRVRRGKIPWTIDQKICLSIFVVIFALGLGGLESDYFSVHKFATVLVILCGVYWFNPKGTLVVAICLGLGRSFLALNLNFVGIYALLCAVVLGFRAKHPYYSIIALLLADIVLGTYFNAYVVYNFYSLLPIFLAVAVFLCIPKRWVDSLGISFYGLSPHIVSKTRLNQDRNLIHTRLDNLGRVFGQMGAVYKNMITSELDAKDLAPVISNTVISTICANCPDRNSCKKNHIEGQEITEAMEKLVTGGIVRGTINPLDAPPVLSMKCLRLGMIIQSSNSLITRARTQAEQNRKHDEGKILVANLLEGVAAVCRNFANNVAGEVIFDYERAERVRDELLFKNIVVLDCIMTYTGGKNYSLSMLVSRKDAESDQIERVASRVCNHKMVVEGIEDGSTAGTSVVTLKTAPRFSVAYGVATIAKHWNEYNGDVHSFLKINNDKTMIAICDGMGSGVRAARASTLSLSLVENFYRALFPSEVIMSNVNKLLTITGQEVFSTLDIAVFDLASGAVDFIKVGAVDGFIKRKREVEVIRAGSLPLGILDEMQPKITHAVLDSGDYVVLCSDGILDAFADERLQLANFINNLDGKTPQAIADEIMHEVLNRTGKMPNDDSTVIVAKLIS